MVEEAPREAHLPAQQPPPRQAPRLSSSHGDPLGPQHRAGPPAQGPPAPVGLIWRIRDRHTFVELRRRGRRARHGSVSVTYLPAAATTTEPPRVAFAVPRKVGTAVVRNRVRRQVKAHLATTTPDRSPMPSGAYLVALAPGAGEVGRAQLLSDVDHCLDRLTGTTR